MDYPIPILLFITNLIFLISFYPSPASGLCDRKERDSLLAIKKSLGNPSSLSSWNASTDCCTWNSVGCDDTESKHVVSLYIGKEKDVNGTIPPEIGNLVELGFIALDHLPGLHGEIPSTIGRLARLGFIYIHHTKLSGSIPSSLGKLKIAHFDLHHCNLTGPILASITQIPTLRRLDLSHNKLSGQIPPFTRELSASLTELDLSHNHLIGKIPPSIRYLDHLDTLVLSHNKLSGALLTSLPSRLREIDVGNNRLSGTVQKTFSKLTELFQIDLSMNLLEGDASMLFNINPSWLENLNISWNNFSFDFGSVEKFADAISSLDASHNQLFGGIPASLGIVNDMVTLYLSHNRLTGRIPSSTLPSQILTWVKIDHNDFIGEIPQAILNSTYLLEIDVSHNKFAGDASSLFRKDDRFARVINLSWNMLSFNLSKVEFSSSMQTLDLSHNRIFGSIPGQIVTVEWLEELDLSYNLLTGEIPQGGKMSSFNQASFEHNRYLCGHPLDPCHAAKLGKTF